MFDGAVLDDGARRSHADLDAALEQLLLDAPPWVPDRSGPVDPPPPPTYGTCTPSGWLALELDTGTDDPGRLTDADLIEALVGFDRVASWAAARQARLLAELAHRRPADAVAHTARTAGVASEYAPDEVGVALHLARGTAAARIDTAARLLTVLPATHALWEAGRIDTLKARAIDDATRVLPDAKAAAVEARVLPRAPEQTLAQLKAALARAVLAVDPDGADDRHREARRDRRVVVTPESDGMGSLWALLTAPDAAGAFTWLTRLARGLGTDDPRSMDARRADLLADLLNGRLIPGSDGGSDGGGDGGGPVTPGKPLVQVVVPHSTLTGADDQPAELAGYGPIPAGLAREIAADAVWRRLVTDPLSGALLDHGRTTYHPPAALADFVRARDVTCRFPGCRRRAVDAELDHLRAWADGGQTSDVNLAADCLHHHRLKHHAGWRVEAHPDGRLTWITPTGHRHTTEPHDYRPDPPPPAPPVSDPDPPPF